MPSASITKVEGCGSLPLRMPYFSTVSREASYRIGNLISGLAGIKLVPLKSSVLMAKN